MDLDKLRKEIDSLDLEINAKLIERLKVVERIALYKKEKGIKIQDEEREKAVLNRIEEQTPKEYSDFTERVFEKIIEISKDYQKALIDENISEEMIEEKIPV